MGECDAQGEKRNECSTLLPNPQRARPQGMCRRMYVDQIETGLAEIFLIHEVRYSDPCLPTTMRFLNT